MAQVLDHVIFAEPDNKAARELAADALEQLGYQAESAPWRNFYLSGARDLRGLPPAVSANAASPVNTQARAMPAACTSPIWACAWMESGPRTRRWICSSA